MNDLRLRPENREHETTSGGVVILCDCSGSMSTTEGDRRRIDLVNDALKPIRADNPNARIIAFASEPRLCRGDLPPTGGGTDLAAAIREAARYRPCRTVILSDGEPNDEAAALKALSELPGVVDVVFCGADSEKSAVKFLTGLARRGGGDYLSAELKNGHRQLTGKLKMLMASKP